jgi:hypothetical protein
MQAEVDGFSGDARNITAADILEQLDAGHMVKPSLAIRIFDAIANAETEDIPLGHEDWVLSGGVSAESHHRAPFL